MSSEEKEEKRITRREFVRGAAVVGAAGVLAGCGPTPEVIKETVEVPVEVTRVVEKQVPGAAEEKLITVLNPLGQPPGQELKPLAPRFDTLDGKTVYIVDVKYPSTKPFLAEVEDALKKKHPQTNWVTREKIGNYFQDDPDLWAEIKEKGAGMVILVGH